MKLSEILKINDQILRTRAFVLGGQNFKVRVPLALEMEIINNCPSLMICSAVQCGSDEP